MVDGMIVPITPITAWTTGQFNRMPIMGGNVQDEGTFGIGITEYFSGPPQVPITAAQYVTNVTNTYSGPEYPGGPNYPPGTAALVLAQYRSEEHTSELQSRLHLVCRLLLEKKKKQIIMIRV